MAKRWKPGMTNLKQWALVGATQRANEIEAELSAIRRAFPSLGSGRAVKATATEVPLPRVRRRRKPMSAAQKKAVGIRMKAYWAARRKAQNK
jgi:hypothetical protein